MKRRKHFRYLSFFLIIEETRKDKELIDKLGNIDSLEHFARENYNLKKENEEIFIIEYKEND